MHFLSHNLSYELSVECMQREDHLRTQYRVEDHCSHYQWVLTTTWVTTDHKQAAIGSHPFHSYVTGTALLLQNLHNRQTCEPYPLRYKFTFGKWSLSMLWDVPWMSVKDRDLQSVLSQREPWIENQDQLWIYNYTFVGTNRTGLLSESV